MSSLGGCLVDSRILGECIKCHYLDVTEEGEGEPTKYLGKCKHFSDGRAPDVLAVNCRIREKGCQGSLSFEAWDSSLWNAHNVGIFSDLQRRPHDPWFLITWRSKGSIFVTLPGRIRCGR